MRPDSQSLESYGSNDLCPDDGGFADKGLAGRPISFYRVRGCPIEEGRS